MHIPAKSPEEFVAAVMSHPSFALDTADWQVLIGRRLPPKKRACRGRPPLPTSVFERYYGRRVAYSGGPAVLVPGGYYWFRRLGVFRHKEWLVASSCINRPPLTGWAKVPANIAAEALRQHAEEYYFMYWPRGLGDVEGHMLIAGASATGKTTLIKRLIANRSHIVVDITPKGEYSQDGACRGSAALSQFTAEELVMLYTVALSAVTGRQEGGAVTGVQYGVLSQLPLDDPAKLLSRLQSVPHVPEMTRQVLASKLAALCKEYREKCVPHPEVVTPTPADCRVYRVEGNDFLRALVAHGIILWLLKRGFSQTTYVVVDEYHRIAPKTDVEDAVELQIRMGRHNNAYMIIATQNPLDLKPSLLGIIPNQAYFRLHGEAAEHAAGVLNVPRHVVEHLAQGQYLAVTTKGPRRWA